MCCWKCGVCRADDHGDRDPLRHELGPEDDDADDGPLQTDGRNSAGLTNTAISHVSPPVLSWR